MARVLVAAQALPLAVGASYFPVTPLVAASAVLAEQGADVVNSNYCLITSGKTVLVVHNTDAAAQTITIHSLVDPQNRVGDITTYSIAVGAIACFGPFVSIPAGWSQTGAQLWFEASAATVKFIALALP